jgi:hypothetical protein
VRAKVTAPNPPNAPFEWMLFDFVFVYWHLILVTPDGPGPAFGAHFYPDFHWLWSFCFDK